MPRAASIIQLWRTLYRDVLEGVDRLVSSGIVDPKDRHRAYVSFIDSLFTPDLKEQVEAPDVVFRLSDDCRLCKENPGFLCDKKANDITTQLYSNHYISEEDIPHVNTLICHQMNLLPQNAAGAQDPSPV
jgi:hypothetical protein